MPMPIRQIGGTGFVGLGDYLDANKGTLDNEFAGIQGDATAAGSAAQSALQDADAQAKAQGAANPGQTIDSSKLPGYQGAIDAAGKAQEIGRSIGSEYGLSGSGKLGKGGEGAFNAALLWGAHGGELGGLGSYLTKLGPGSVDTTIGGEATPPPPPAPPPEPPQPPETGGEQPAQQPGAGATTPYNGPPLKPRPTPPGYRPGKAGF